MGTQCLRYWTTASLPPPQGTGVSQPSSLPSSQCLTSFRTGHENIITAQLWARENSGFGKCFAHDGILPCLWVASRFPIQTVLSTAKATERSLGEHLMLSVDCREVRDTIHLQMFFWSVAFTNHTQGNKSHPTSRPELARYLVALFDVPTAGGLSGKPRAVTEAESITKRSFQSLEMERAGTHLVPGKSVLPSDALVLLSLDKAQAELKARVQSCSWPRRGWCSVIVAENNTYVFFHRVPVGLEARSSLVGGSGSVTLMRLSSSYWLG